MNYKRGLVAVPAVLALSLAACSSGNSEGGSSAAATDSASAASTTGVVLANGTEPQNPLIPANTNEVGGGRIVDLLFAGLVYYDEKGNVVNDMAEKIETDDSQTYNVTLKEGQTFSDGTPVTAASFVDAWNLGAADGGMLSVNFYAPIEGTDDAGADADGDGKLSGLTVVDDTHFTIKLKQPEADFPLRLGYSAFYPLPQSTLDDVENGGEHPVGNGPYKLASDDAWEHNVQIQLVPNETYKGGRQAKNGGVTFMFYAEADAAYNDLLAGNLDVLDEIPDSAVETFQDELGDRAVNQPSALNQTITIPESLAHFSGEEGRLRRQAISHAIDRATITKTIFSDTRSPAVDFTSPVVNGFNDDLEGSDVLDFDAAKAKELWAQADAISPWDGTFEIAYNADGPHEAWVTAVANQLKNNLGIDAAGKAYPDFKSLRQEVTDRTIKTAFRTGWQADYPSAFNFLSPIFATGAGSNDGDYSDPDFDDLLNQAAAASSTEESNKLLGEAQGVLFKDLPAIPLWYQNAIGGYSEAVNDVVFGWNSVPLYYEITKAE
ncbi:MAG: ABC transporter substrate-binding protein [Ancrocorticia sp.]|jgi:oligopeptide transport system substrate-binding protein|nr:ABC transporter substrate-binding protein [Ancrocorticia sp.]MCI1933371.1 ABC transporter substrate-binding protein [Ancrocorticia sp.]